MKLQGHNFTTNVSALNFVRQFLIQKGICNIYKYDSDFDFLYELLTNHPEASKKLAHGLCHFRIVRNLRNPKALETRIVNSEGCELDFSWRNCITGKSNSIYDNLRNAMRRSIYEQIKDFRNIFFSITNFILQ